MAGFIEELKGILDGESGSVLAVAGVDFSHIGPKFGHSSPASAMKGEAEAHDRALIDALCRGDVGSLWAESRRVSDRFNVCGFSALALLLEAFPGALGRLLGYDIWMEEATHSAVGFAALHLER